jgi:hypothetical protein
MRAQGSVCYRQQEVLMRARLAAVIAGALLVTACTDTNSPVAPELLANRVAGHGDKGATDQYFFWLPPFFDGFTGWRVKNVKGLAPEVQVFACPSTDTGPVCGVLGAQVADMPASDGWSHRNWRERLDHYVAPWKVDQDLAGDSYRVCVGLPQEGGGMTYLGHADIQVVNPQHRGKHRWGARGREGDWHASGAKVLAGSTVPVEFKIGDGYQDATSDAACPAAFAATATLTGTVGTYVYGVTTPIGGATITVFSGSNQVGDVGVSDASGAYTLNFPGPSVAATYSVCASVPLVGVVLQSSPADAATPPTCPASAPYGHSLTVNPGDSPTLNFVFLF